MSYYLINKLGNGFYETGESKFFSFIFPCKDIEELNLKLKDIKQQYKNANHFCYAYSFKNKQTRIEYSSDAGEPRGSAGWPILNEIRSSKLINIAICVVRIFGGKKIGISSLIKAYSLSSICAIKDVKHMPWVEKDKISLVASYELSDIVDYGIKKFDLEIITQHYSNIIELECFVETSKLSKMRSYFIYKSSMQIEIKII